MDVHATLGRYRLYDVLAKGGMASVHLGRLDGAMGFVRAVAIKRLHPHLAHDPEFVSMFIDEARVTGRIKHPNVVALHDVVSERDELFLVMDYICGVSLMQIVRHEEPIALAVASALLRDMLRGLHAAHETRGSDGQPLGIVHRDVSPHNVIAGLDGVARVLDFGIAKAKSRIQTTQDGRVKGKISYMAPEQLDRKPLDRRTDVYASGVVAWELIAGEPLFRGETGEVMARIMRSDIPPLESVRDGVPPEVEACIRKALAADPEHRYATAQEFATALEAVIPPAPPQTVAEWVEHVGGATLQEARARLERIESEPADAAPTTTVQPSDVPTQIVSSQNGTTPPKRRRWPLLAILVAAAIVGIFLWFRREATPVAPLPREPAGTNDGGEATESGPGADASVPSPPMTAAAKTPDAAAVPTQTSPLPTHAPTTTPRPAASRSCDPETFIDDEGIKRVKPWCR